MGIPVFDRTETFSRLRRYERALGEAVRRSLADTRLPDYFHLDGRWVLWGEQGERVRRVERALALSEGLALRELERQLAGLDVAAVWPLLKELCLDIAAYVVGGAAAGGAIGAGAGLLGGGIGAAPGAAAGAGVGVQAAGILMGWMGLKEAAEYVASALPRATDEYRQGFRLAWGPMPRNDRGGAVLFAGDFMCSEHTGMAARSFAAGHVLIVLALLTGLTAWLTRGRGDVAGLLAGVRHHARLGPRLADWLTEHRVALAAHPRLQARHGGSGAAGGGTAGRQEAVPPQSTARKGVYGEAKADAFMQKQGFEKLNRNGRLTQVDDAPSGWGIDGVWKNKHPPPDYVITEAKYGAGRLGMTRDGRQMSDEWISGSKTGFDRLERAIKSKEIFAVREAVEAGRIEKWLLEVSQTGQVSKTVLDAAGRVIK